jgi:putative addiction module killer protein
VEAKPKTLRIYQTAAYRQPFTEWMDAHQRQKIWEIINARLEHVKAGSFGKCRFVGEGVIELKINFNQGYRVYIGVDGDEVILLFVSEKGTEKAQNADIRTAQDYWSDYNA